MSRHPGNLRIALAALFLLVASSPLMPQQPAPAAKAAPKNMEVTTAVTAARAAFDAALPDILNTSFRRADVALRRALELDSSFALARSIHAVTAPGMTQAARISELNRALADGARASTPELLAIIAVRDAVRGDQPTAITVAHAAHTSVPDDPYLAFLDAVIRMRPGTEGDVIPIAQDYLARNPDQAFMVGTLAYGLFMSGKRTEGLEAARRYLAMLPDHPNPHDTYGELLRRSGELDEAAREYEKALALDPGWTQSHGALGNIAYLRHDYAAAGQHLQALLAAAPDIDARLDARRQLAWLAVFARQQNEVRQQLQACASDAEQAKLPDDAAYCHGELAVLEAAAGRAREAQHELAAVPAGVPSGPFIDPAIVHATLGEASAVHDDLAQLSRKPGGADALPFVEALEAIARGDIAGARAQLAAVKDPGYRVEVQALVLRAARRSKDTEAARAAESELAVYQDLCICAAFAHLVAGRP